ncbi:MAG: DUF4386 domain-containing protein [Acidobacteria bacterium]|nr:MAG: DUF4386 domain-containing protein [Acidobacteriota bacterium]
MSTAVMTNSIAESSPLFRADIAGVLYLTSILTGAAAAFVRWRLVIPDNATATATNILAHEPLFRMLLAADLISASCYVAVTLLFYEMFKRVNRHLSLLTAFLSFLSCAIVAFGCLFHVAALVVLRGAQYLNILSVHQLPALALACLKLRAQVYNISLVFMGFSCLLIGYLIFRSTFLPKIVGALMAFAGLAWLTFMSPALAAHLSPYIVAPGLLGEGTLTVWLLVIGALQGPVR